MRNFMREAIARQLTTNQFISIDIMVDGNIVNEIDHHPPKVDHLC
jgi:hypothetical protein